MAYTFKNLVTDFSRSLITETVGYSTPLNRITTATAPNVISYAMGKFQQLNAGRKFIKLSYTTSQGAYNYYYSSVAKFLITSGVVKSNYELVMTRWLSSKEIDNYKRAGKYTANNDMPEVGEGSYNLVYEGSKITVESIKTTRPNTYGGGNVTSSIFKVYGNEEVCKRFIFHCYELQINSMRDIATYSWGHKWMEQKLYNCKTFENLFLDATFKQSIIDDLNKFRDSEEKYAKLGLCWKRGYLFYGKPGCGKTSTIYAIARYLKYNIYRINKSSIQSASSFRSACNAVGVKSLVVIDEVDQNIDVVDKTLKIDISYEELKNIIVEILTTQSDIIYGEINNSISDLPDIPQGINEMMINDIAANNRSTASKIANVILEIEAAGNAAYLRNKMLVFAGGKLLSHAKLAAAGDTTPLREFLWRFVLSHKPELSQRATVHTSTTNGIGLGDLLEILDGNEYLYGCIVVLTSNFPERIAGALLRPGRVDKIMEFGLANADIINEIAREFAGKDLKLNIPDGFKCSQAEIIGLITHYINDAEKITEIINNFCNSVELPECALGRETKADAKPKPATTGQSAGGLLDKMVPLAATNTLGENTLGENTLGENTLGENTTIEIAPMSTGEIELTTGSDIQVYGGHSDSFEGVIADSVDFTGLLRPSLDYYESTNLADTDPNAFYGYTSDPNDNGTDDSGYDTMEDLQRMDDFN